MESSVSYFVFSSLELGGSGGSGSGIHQSTCTFWLVVVLVVHVRSVGKMGCFTNIQVWVK